MDDITCLYTMKKCAKSYESAQKIAKFFSQIFKNNPLKYKRIGKNIPENEYHDPLVVEFFISVYMCVKLC